jgi:chromosome segregation ATPase
MARRLISSLVALAALALAAPARADDAEEQQLRDQLRSTTLQLRALQDAQAAQAAQQQSSGGDVDAMKKELSATKAKLKAARASSAKVRALQAQVDQDKAAADKAAQDLQQTQAQLAQYTQGFQQASAQAAAAGAERDRLKGLLTQTSATLNACQARNAELVKVSRELVKAYARVDLPAVLATREPFLGLKRVQLENLAQGYDDRIHNARCAANAAGPAVPTGP